MARLTDYQWLILWELADSPSRFWRRGDDWYLAGYHKITLQVAKLLQRNLIMLQPGDSAYDSPLAVTDAGHRALRERDYMDVLGRQNKA